MLVGADNFRFKYAMLSRLTRYTTVSVSLRQAESVEQDHDKGCDHPKFYECIRAPSPNPAFAKNHQ